jgi:hypothetical protein
MSGEHERNYSRVSVVLVVGLVARIARILLYWSYDHRSAFSGCIIMKKPFLHAFGAALYIATIVLVLQVANLLLKSQNGTILIPMAMLSMFTLSAAIMGYLFLSEPLYLLVENKKQEAIVFFFKTVGFFACFGLFFAALLFLM